MSVTCGSGRARLQRASLILFVLFCTSVSGSFAARDILLQWGSTTRYFEDRTTDTVIRRLAYLDGNVTAVTVDPYSPSSDCGLVFTDAPTGYTLSDCAAMRGGYVEAVPPTALGQVFRHVQPRPDLIESVSGQTIIDVAASISIVGYITTNGSLWTADNLGQPTPALPGSSLFAPGLPIPTTWAVVEAVDDFFVAVVSNLSEIYLFSGGNCQSNGGNLQGYFAPLGFFANVAIQPHVMLTYNDIFAIDQSGAQLYHWNCSNYTPAAYSINPPISGVVSSAFDQNGVVGYIVDDTNKAYQYQDGVIMLQQTLTGFFQQKSLRQMMATADAFLFLMVDGTLWAMNGPDYPQAISTTLIFLPDANQIFQIPLSPGLPPGYFIQQLYSASSSSTVLARAVPSTPLTVEPPLLLPPPALPSPSDVSILTWGDPSIVSGVGFTDSVLYEIGMLGETFVDLRFLYTGGTTFNDTQAPYFTALDVQGTHAIAMDDFGYVYVWGQDMDGRNPGQELSPFRPYSTAATPIMVDPTIYGGPYIVNSVAINDQNVYLLLSNGSVIQWGLGPAQSTFTQPTAKPVMINSAPLASFANVTVSTFLTSIQAIKAGGWNSVVMNGASGGFYLTLSGMGPKYVTSLNSAFGTLWENWILQLPAPNSPQPDYLVTGYANSVGVSYLVFVLPAYYNSSYFFQFQLAGYTPLPENNFFQFVNLTLPFSYLANTPISAASHEVIVWATNIGWYIFDPFGNFFDLAYPLPMFFGFNLTGEWSNSNSVESISVGNSLIVKTTDGRTFASCGDWLTGCSLGYPTTPNLPMYEILKNFSVNTLVSTRANGNQGLQPSFAIVSPLSVDSSPLDLNATNMILSFGEDFYGTRGSGNAHHFPEGITLLSTEHPMNSPTATNISVGMVVSMADGNFTNNGTGEFARIIRWGGSQDDFEGTGPYTKPCYMAADSSMNNPLPIGTHVTSVMDTAIWIDSNVSVAFFGSQLVYFGSKRTLDVQWANNFVDDFYSRDQVGIYALRGPSGGQSYYSATLGLVTLPLTAIETLKCSAVTWRSPRDWRDNFSNDYPPFWCIGATPQGVLMGFASYNLGSPTYSGRNAVTAADGVLGQYYFSNSGPIDYSYGELLLTSPEAPTSLSQLGLAQFELGERHVLALDNSGTLWSWGSNKYGQLGIGSANESALDFQSQVIPPTDIFGPITKIATSAYNSFAMWGNIGVIAWGDNRFGLLGTGFGPQNMTSALSPVHVYAPHLPMSDIKCAAFTCFILYESGNVFSWGGSNSMSLGRASDAPFDSTPRLADQLIYPGARRQIVELITSPHASTIFARAVLATLPPPPVVVCTTPQPGPYFECINGQWIEYGNINVGGQNATNGTTSVVINVPTTVVGNVTVAPSGTIIFIVPTNLSAFNDTLLNVSGCLQLHGSLNLTTDPSQWEIIQGHTLHVVESNCSMISSDLQQLSSDVTNCRTLTSTVSQNQKPSGRYGLNAIFQVSPDTTSNGCTSPSNFQWWIVVVAVVGGVLLLVIIGVIIGCVRYRKVHNQRASDMELQDKPKSQSKSAKPSGGKQDRGQDQELPPSDSEDN